MNLTLQQLKVLLTVTQVQSVSLAAKQLQLRQSTVSFHLQSLESAAGVVLLIRTKQRWELTEAGKEMVKYAQTMIQTAEEAERVMLDFQTVRQRRLLIGTSHVPATFIVPFVVQKFHAAYPDVYVEVESEPSPTVRRRVEEKRLDVGFIIDAQPVSPPLQSLLLMEDEIGCVYSANTGLQWLKGRLDAHQLSAIPLIGHAAQSSTAQVCQEWAQRQNVSLKSAVTLGSIGMMKTAVKHGMGAALLSKLMVYDEIEAGELLYAPLEDAPRRQLRLLYHKDHGLDSLDRFVQVVQRTVESGRFGR